MRGVRVVALCRLGMMSSFFVIARLVVLGGFSVVAGGVLMMIGGVLVVLCGFLGHTRSSHSIQDRKLVRAYRSQCDENFARC